MRKRKSQKSWRKPQKDENNKFITAILFSGGMGDILIYGLVIQELSKQTDCDYSIDYRGMRKTEKSFWILF
jgi:hypothetical protein